MHTQQDSDAALQNNLTISEKSVVPYTHSSGYAIASLILGIISSALAWRSDSLHDLQHSWDCFCHQSTETGKSFPQWSVTAGLILCICGFVLSLLFLAYWIWYLFVFLCTVETQPHHEHRRRCQNIMDIQGKISFVIFYFQRYPIIFSSL